MTDAPTTVTVQAPDSVTETLRRARALIRDTKCWTQGAYARRTKRAEEPVSASGPDARAWCAVGALRRVDGVYEIIALKLLAEAIEGRKFHNLGYAEDNIVAFNDTDGRRHLDVVQAFDKAIALAEKQP